jgi:AraC-like DNA-binding protein
MLKKKEGFTGQRSIVLPRKILAGMGENNPLAERLYVTDIGYYPKAQYHYRQRAHGIDQYILIYCVEGRGTAEIARKKYELEPGSFIIIPAGEQHCYSASEENSWTIYWVHFKGADARTLVSALMDKFHHHQGAVAFQAKRISLFEDIYACLERGYGNDNLSYANVCLYHYIASFVYQDKFNLTDNQQAGDAVELSINYMQQHLACSLSLEEIAASINFSASHYSAIFRKKTGFSPIEYFNHLKIQKACQYLIFTDLRIKEISDKLGIEDPFYFSRMFNKLMGMSPNQYRVRKHL